MIKIFSALILFFMFTVNSGYCAQANEKKFFQEDGFYDENYPYKISYSQGQRILSDSWQLENFKFDKKGKPTKRKEGPGYETMLWLDCDGDGKYEKIKEYPTYDLLYTNVYDNGSIWLRSVPLSTDMDKKKLRVLLRNYVDAMAGEGITAVRIGYNIAIGSARRFATKIVDSGTGVVSGREAYMAIIEIANVDQLELSPESRWSRNEIVLIRADYAWSSTGFKSAVFPVIMVAGYSNLPEDFESGKSDFREFLTSIDLNNFQSLGDEIDSAVLSCAPTVDRIRLSLSKSPRKSYYYLKDSLDLNFEQIECAKKIIGRQKDSFYLIYRNPQEKSRETILPDLKLDSFLNNNKTGGRM